MIFIPYLTVLNYFSTFLFLSNFDFFGMKISRIESKTIFEMKKTEDKHLKTPENLLKIIKPKRHTYKNHQFTDYKTLSYDLSK